MSADRPVPCPPGAPGPRGGLEAARAGRALRPPVGARPLLRRLPGLPRPAAPGRRSDGCRHAPRRGDGEDPLRRRPAGGPPRLRGRGHRWGRGADRRRRGPAHRSGARSDGRADLGVRPCLSAAEEPHPPGPPPPRPRGGLPRGRDQRRPVAPHRRRWHLGVHRSGRGARGGRHRAPRAEPRGPPRRHRRGPEVLRERHEVPPDGHELELREHAQHGRGLGLPPVPADAPDPESSSTTSSTTWRR